jgi:hypothetical protein
MRHGMILLLAVLAAQAAFVPAGRRGGDGVLCSIEENDALLRGCGHWLEAWSGLPGEPVLEARLDLEEPVVDLARLPEGPVVALTREGTLVGVAWDGAAPEELWRLEVDELSCAQRLEPWRGGLLVAGEIEVGVLRVVTSQPEYEQQQDLPWGPHDACLFGDTLLIDTALRCEPFWEIWGENHGVAWDGESWQEMAEGTFPSLGYLSAWAVDGSRLAALDMDGWLTLCDRAAFATPLQGWLGGSWAGWGNSALALTGEQLVAGLLNGVALYDLSSWAGGMLEPLDTQPLQAVSALAIVDQAVRVDHAEATDWITITGDSLMLPRRLPNAANAPSLALGDSLAAFLLANGDLELHRLIDGDIDLAWSGPIPYDGDPHWDGARLVFVDRDAERSGWLDCSDPQAPLLLGQVEIPGLRDARVWSDRLAVRRNDAVSVYDVADPGQPQLLLEAAVAELMALEGVGPTLGLHQADGTLRALQLDADPPWLGEPLPVAVDEDAFVVTLRDRLLVARNLPIGNYTDFQVEVWNAGLATPQLLSSSTVYSIQAQAVFANAGRLTLFGHHSMPIWNPDVVLRSWRVDDADGLQLLSSIDLPWDTAQPVAGGTRLACRRPDHGWFLYREDSQVAVEPAPVRPAGLALAAAPNPFNPSCVLSFELARPAQVELGVYNLLGERVATLQQGRLPAGAHRQVFDGEGLPSGLYLAQLTAGGEARAIKLTLLR